MNAPEDLNRLYANVSDNISSAMADILSLNVEHSDGKREIGNITGKLREIQMRFDRELQELEAHAEWDTFTLAFFGETNAGKSTIIESLRILFKEESRQALLKQHADDLEQFSQALNAHLEHVREGLHALYKEYTDELTSISQSTNRLTRIAQQEAQERNAIAKAEADARTLLDKQEARARLEMQQQEAAHRQQLAEQESNARLAEERKEAAHRQQLAEQESSARLFEERQEAQARLEVQQQEAADRQQLAEQESNARLAEERKEASQRLKIEQANALSRFKVRVALVSIGGILIGATSAVALLKLAGA